LVNAFGVAEKTRQHQRAATALPSRAKDINRWYQELDSLCASGDAEDDHRLQLALAEAQQKAKAMVRRDTMSEPKSGCRDNE
jgi:hypothetical protein